MKYLQILPILPSSEIEILSKIEIFFKRNNLLTCCELYWYQHCNSRWPSLHQISISQPKSRSKRMKTGTILRSRTFSDEPENVQRVISSVYLGSNLCTNEIWKSWIWALVNKYKLTNFPQGLPNFTRFQNYFILLLWIKNEMDWFTELTDFFHFCFVFVVKGCRTSFYRVIFN